MQKKPVFLIAGVLAVFVFTVLSYGVPPTDDKTPGKFLPDLVVEKVWLDEQCQVNFVLKNAGKGSIPSSSHIQGTVKVYSGAVQEIFYFTRVSAKGKPPVDPGGGLKTPGGSVTYNTGIKLNAPVDVIVSVNEDKKILEAGYANNKRPGRMLKPACFSKTDSRPPKPPGGGFPIGIDRGIVVNLIPPKSNYNPGETLHIRYRFRDPDTPNPLHTTIYLHQQDHGHNQMWRWAELWNIAAGRATIAAGEVSVPVTIPSAMVQGYPYIITVYRSGESWGESNRFIIGNIADAGSSGTGGRELELISPASGDIWRRGDERLIKWRTPFPIRPSITLMKGNRIIILERDQGGRIVYDPASKTYVYQLRVPRDIELGSDYKARIIDLRNPSVHQESGNFVITDEALDFQVTDVRANMSGQLLVTAVARGSFSGPVIFRIARVTDYNFGEAYRTLETWEIPAAMRSGASELNLGSAVSPGTAACGENYEIRIDFPDRISEVHENNNTLVKRVFFQPDRGMIEIKKGDRILNHQDTITFSRNDKPIFSVWLRNCGNNRGRGSVEIRQIGRWEEIVPGGYLTTRTRMVDHDIPLGFKRIDLASGAPADYATMNERDPESQSSRIEIRLTGDIAGWAPANPMIIHVR